MKDLFLNEPTLIINLIKVVLTAAATFGLHLSPEQIIALVAVLTAAGALVNRALVVPTAKL